jgi:hypothetical protein
MTREEVLKYLQEDEQGKALLEELKKPLVAKRDELLGSIKDLTSKLAAAEQRKADADRLLIDERQAVRLMAVDQELERQFKRLEIPKTHWAALSAHLKAHHEIELKANGQQREAQIKGQKISEFLDVWKHTDEAKALLPAPVNTGGSAEGSSESAEIQSFEEKLLKLV